jgi:hypothetical protein
MSTRAMIKFFSVLSTVLLSANILAWSAPAIAALTSKQVNDIAKQITVRIDGSSKGSGVIVKREGNVYTVLTNAHVLPKKGKYTVQTQDNQTHNIDYQNVKLLPNKIDLATFQFSSNKAYKVGKLSNSDDVFWTHRIYVAGYPIPDQQIVKPTLTFLGGAILNVLDDPYPKGYALVYNNPAKKGMSGGPILNDEGEVVGINGISYQDSRTQAVTFMGIPINTCIKLAPNTCSIANKDSKPGSEQIIISNRIRGWGGKCLDVVNNEGKGPQNGTPVVIWDCRGTENQKWQINSDGTISGWGGKCLDVINNQNKGPQSGTPVVIWDCRGTENQKWQINSDGTISGWGGKCLDIINNQNKGPQSGTPVVIWDCRGTENQKWQVQQL